MKRFDSMIYRLMIFFLLSNQIFFSICCAQAVNKTVNVGDIISDIPIDVYRGDTSFKSYLYDFKSELIILDFWGVHCGACVTAMPRMLDLQKRFGKKIQILLVTPDSKEDIRKLFFGLKKYKTLPTDLEDAFKSLTFVTDDSSFSKMFPHKVIPAHAWIGKNYTFRSLSYENSTNYGNISNFLSGQDIKWATIKSGVADFSNPFIAMQQQVDHIDSGAGYSILTQHMDFGMGANSYIGNLINVASGKVIGAKAVNEKILNLYQFVFKDQIDNLDLSRIVVLSRDSSRFYSPSESSASWSNWAEDNTYCYFIKSPSKLSVDYLAKMRCDLDEYFRLKSVIEYRKIRCFVLKERGVNLVGYGLVGNDVLDSISENLDIKRVNHTYDLYSFLRIYFSNEFPNEPFFYDGKFGNIKECIIPWSYRLKDLPIEILKSALKIQGFDLLEEYKVIPMLVIRDA